MTRTRVFHGSSQDTALPYNLRFNAVIVKQIKHAKDCSTLTWSDWVAEAFICLKKESDIEVESLILEAEKMITLSKEKVKLPFRVRPAEVDIARVLASKYNTNIQSVLTAAMLLYSLTVSFSFTDASDENNE